MKKSYGFTVIELLVVIIILAGAGVLFFLQKNDMRTAQDDSQRKTAINAMYYSLEEAFYPANEYYPSTIDESVLTTMDPDLFVDPNGVKIGEPGSSYRYEATGCVDEKCSRYRLTANLDSEADYVKTNRNR